jgi:hypothetical protein
MSESNIYLAYYKSLVESLFSCVYWMIHNVVSMVSNGERKRVHYQGRYHLSMLVKGPNKGKC